MDGANAVVIRQILYHNPELTIEIAEMVEGS
jgi:hypothetical protein